MFLLFGLLPEGGAASYTELSGDLPAVVNAGKSPYLVVADIFVPSGKAVKIEPGTVLLFRNFTGMHVRGVLSAGGSRLRPIVFTSANDRSYNDTDSLNPTPYDWNGIYIQKDGMGTVMEYFKVCYSVKGIVSETKFINLSHGMFTENGRSHCIIEGEQQTVTPGTPFSHSVALKDATVDGVPVKILRDPQAKKRTTVRYTGLTLLVGGVALGGVTGWRMRESMAEYAALQSRDSVNIVRDNGDVLWNDAKDRFTRDRAGVIAGALLSLLGGIGLWWTFTF